MAWYGMVWYCYAGDQGVSFSRGGQTIPYDASGTVSRVLQDIGESHGLDFLLHFGDISYARGVGFVWEQWHALIEPVSARIPYMVSIGNHGEYTRV
jgi:acid phosphatase type 7